MMHIYQMMQISMFRNAKLDTFSRLLNKSAPVALKIVNFAYLKTFALNARAHTTKLWHSTKEPILAKNVNTDACNASEGQTLIAIPVNTKNWTKNVNAWTSLYSILSRFDAKLIYNPKSKHLKQLMRSMSKVIQLEQAE